MLLLFSGWNVSRVPVGRDRHHFLESLAFIDLVMAVAVKHDKLFRFTCTGVERFTLSWRDQPIIVGGDEQDWSRRDFVDHPLGIKAKRVVNEFERDCGDSSRVVAAGSHAELGGLAVRQQDLGTFYEF